jgi:hypothetical protein
MRAHLLSAPVRLVALALPLALIACAASSSGGDAPASTEVAPTVPAPAPGSSAQPDAGTGGTDSAAPPPKNDCKLVDLQGVADVAPTFTTYAAPSVVPATMTGGTLQGEYKVDKATVYLPSGTGNLVDARNSTGSVNAWAIFNGTNYSLHLKAAFTLATVAGPQAQGTDTSSQGAFTTTGPVLTLDHACDGALTDEADYSFTDTGNGRATILIKTPTPYGDTYLQLDAAKK